MESADSIVEQLKKEEQTLLLRLAGIRQALDAYVMGKLSPVHPDATQGNGARSGPTLDGMRIPDAVSVYLSWARDNGRDRVMLSELADALGSSRIMSALGKPIASIWKPLTNTLSAPGNIKTWIVTRGSEGRFLRTDTVELRASHKKT
jgi:hypothetical protein